MVIFFFTAGLVLLIVGAEALVRGSSRLAAAIGISPLIIGLTVVAFGTSSPELAVSVKAAVSDQANIVIGNVIGSNIFNILFILGLSAMIAPLIVSRQLIRLDVPLMVAAAALCLPISADALISRGEGAMLFLGLVAYIAFLIYISRKESRPVQDEFAVEFGQESSTAKHWLKNIGLVAGGLGMLILGSKWLVDGAVSMAHYFGVSDLIIGLTIVAAGTSLPEVVTSVIASLRGERDIAVGNVVGSNLFNTLGVLGLAGVIAPSGVAVSSAAMKFDMPIMVAASLACLPIFFSGKLIARWEGALLFAYYIAYTVFLVLTATKSVALPMFNAAMLYFVIPITTITLLTITVRALRRRKLAR